LIEAEHEDEIIHPVLFGQGLDGFLLRKTCGAGGRSDEAGCRFVYDLGARGFDAMSHCEARYVIAFAEDGCLLPFEHVPIPYKPKLAFVIGFKDEGYPIVELG